MASVTAHDVGFFFNFWQILLKIGIFPYTLIQGVGRLCLTRRFRFIRARFSLPSVRLGVYFASSFSRLLYEIVIFKRFSFVARRSCCNARSRRTVGSAQSCPVPYHVSRITTGKTPFAGDDSTRPNCTTPSKVPFSHVFLLRPVPDTSIVVLPSCPHASKRLRDPPIRFLRTLLSFPGVASP